MSEKHEVLVNGKVYSILGAGVYATENNPRDEYEKYFLVNHKVVLVIPGENLVYFGDDKGRINEFDGFPQQSVFNGKTVNQVNHDHQVEKRVLFGETEGPCEFWDYESEDGMYISAAVLEKNGERSDVVLEPAEVKFL